MEAIWNSNPDVKMMYCFEDGNCFIKHGDAASYARTTGMPYTVKARPTEETENKLTNQKTTKK